MGKHMNKTILFLLLMAGLASCASLSPGFADLDRMADDTYDVKYTHSFIDSISDAIESDIRELDTMEKVKYINSYIHDSLNISYIDVPFDSIAPYYGFLSELVQERKGNCMAFTTLYYILLNQFDVDNYALTFPKHILLTFPYRGNDYFIETTSGVIHNSTDYLMSDTVKPDKWDNMPLGHKEFMALYRYNVALELSKSNDYDNIYKLMSRAYEDYSEPFHMSDLYAYSAFKTGDFETSADIYRKLEKTDRNTRMNLNAVYINWGNAMADQGDYESALKLYKDAMDVLPGDQIAGDNYAAVSNNYAVNLANQKRFSDAVDVLKRAHEINKAPLINNAFIYTYNAWGNHYFNSNSYEKAIEMYLKGINYGEDEQIQSNIVSAYVNWGNDMIARENFIEAENKFNRAFEYDPYNIYAYRGLANIAFNKGEYSNGGDYFIKAIEYGDSSSNTYYSAGVSYFNAKEYRQAKEILNMGLSKFTDEAFTAKAKKILDMME